MRTLLVMVIVALATAASAAAGGFATVGLDSQPPDGGGPGSTWDVKLNVLQHGQTPLDGISPTIVIRNLDTGAAETFAATPTGEPGKYAAKVVFATAGRWEYSVNDGFSQTHTFKPISIAGTPGSTGTGDGGSFPVAWTAAGSVAILLALIALFVIVRRPPRARPGTAVPTS